MSAALDAVSAIGVKGSAVPFFADGVSAADSIAFRLLLVGTGSAVFGEISCMTLSAFLILPISDRYACIMSD